MLMVIIWEAVEKIPSTNQEVRVFMIDIAIEEYMDGYIGMDKEISIILHVECTMHTYS